MENNEIKFACGLDKNNGYNCLELSDGNLLTTDGWSFKIHKIILARCSDYFCALFCGLSKDKTEFTIPGISGECLRDILCYIYSGNIRIAEKNVADLLIAADYLLLKDLYLEIKQNLRSNMTDVNCLKILKAADEIGEKKVYRECFRFTQTRFEWIMLCENNGLADLPSEILETVLRSRSLYVFSERTVWQTIVEWTQKDIPHRLSCVPRLLLSLAIAEVEEELAEDILQHKIIVKNYLLKDLNGIKYSNDHSSNLQMFSNLLQNRLFHISEPCYFRIPINIHIVCFCSVGDDGGGTSNFYVTYDENTDLWSKISDIDFQPDILKVIGHNIYVFELKDNICMIFDLSAMNWVPMKACRYIHHDPCVVTIDHYIYVLGRRPTDFRNWSYDVEIYDTKINRWFQGSSLREISHGFAVSIERKIYVVGNDRNFDTIVMYVFDSDSKQWSLLSSPNIFRSNFALVGYRQKVYLIGGYDKDTQKAEVYDPATNLWKELPDLPTTYHWINAIVFNDQIIVYEEDTEVENMSKNIRWNLENERWEQLEETSPLKDFHLHRFCTIDDAETIKMLTKRNRDPKIHLERSYFK